MNRIPVRHQIVVIVTSILLSVCTSCRPRMIDVLGGFSEHPSGIAYPKTIKQLAGDKSGKRYLCQVTGRYSKLASFPYIFWLTNEEKERVIVYVLRSAENSAAAPGLKEGDTVNVSVIAGLIVNPSDHKGRLPTLTDDEVEKLRSYQIVYAYKLARL